AAKLPLDARAALPVRERLDAAWAALDRADTVIDAIRPAKPVAAGTVTSEHERYFALKELADAIGDTLNNYEDRLEDRKRSYMEASQPEAPGRRARYRSLKVSRIVNYDHVDAQPLSSLSSAESMEEALRELFETAEPLPDDQDLFEVENRLSLLNLMAT